MIATTPSGEASTAPLVVGLGDLGVARGAGQLSTYALGSCVGAVLCDPEARVAALLHFMLPNSEIDPIRARTRPMMFADLGLPAAAQACVRLGAKPTRWVARLAGGAAVQGGPSGFDIGARNIEAAMYHLHLLAIPVVAQELGGTISRTLHVDVPTGRARVLTPGLPDRLL